MVSIIDPEMDVPSTWSVGDTASVTANVQYPVNLNYWIYFNL